MAFAVKKRDLLLLAIAVIILAFLWQAPPESTSRVPYDDTHKTYYDIARNEGKKAAEKYCEDCHNPEQVPFPEGHPAKYRCLFCHKLERT
ncbi:MAG: cytochrome c [Deltaproteobacteria bacterium]|jgi:formate-dependent nitrite reductase cytochrome c552 subunit|nr:cytochrome c [Deltaproteobacteria bacterium]